MSIYSFITRGRNDRVLYKQGILNAEGRLSESGMRDFVDLLFIGKSIDEARQVLVEAAKEINEEK